MQPSPTDQPVLLTAGLSLERQLAAIAVPALGRKRRWMRKLFTSLLLASFASRTGAQWVWDDRDGEGIIKPQTSYPVGSFDTLLKTGWASLRARQRMEKGCRERGCLIIVNDTLSYQLREFYVRPTRPRRASDWGSNQLDRPLRSKEAIIRFKLPDQRFCDWPARFVLRNPKTKETVTADTNLSLCATPMRDTLLRLRYVRKEVIVGQP